MIELIPVFAHGVAGMEIVYLTILVGLSLGIGTTTTAVIAAVSKTKKWSWRIWFLSVPGSWAVVYYPVVYIDYFLKPQLYWFRAFWVVAPLVLATITAAVFKAVTNKKWSWRIWLLSVFAWLMILATISDLMG